MSIAGTGSGSGSGSGIGSGSGSGSGGGGGGGAGGGGAGAATGGGGGGGAADTGIWCQVCAHLEHFSLRPDWPMTPSATEKRVPQFGQVISMLRILNRFCLRPSRI